MTKSLKPRAPVRDAKARAVLTEQVCARIADGEVLGAILGAPGMPEEKTFLGWLAASPELAGRYSQACGRPYARGRPTLYCPEIAAAVCEALEGPFGLDAVCADPSLPSQATVYRWLATYPDFAQRYGKAREIQAHRMFDMAWSIAQRTQEDRVRADKLRIDTIRWQVGKLAPRVYGAKPESAEDREPLEIVIRRLGPDGQWLPLPDEKPAEGPGTFRP